MRLEKADIVIYLNLSRFVCLTSYIKRVIPHIGKGRADMQEVCLEKLDFKFMKYTWNFPKTSGRRNKERLGMYSNKKYENMSIEMYNSIINRY
ncbi:MAG: hypothetical protein HPY74_08120 [Firmicutes bacterium]|nr:hypothetical protein [Bacillota bacterium]